MMPNLSVRNSTLPPLASRTARATSCVTVPDLGFGIRPRGPRTLPNGPTFDIMSGVAIAESKSVHPSVTRLTRSSPPTTSAPASWASRAFSPTAKTATRTFLPVPLGSTTDPRTICSAWRGSTPSRICASTVASNLEIDVSRTIWQAISGSRPPLPLLATAASTFLAASMYFLPLFFGIGLYSTTSRPIERAVPSIIFMAGSASYAFRSLRFTSTICRSCWRVTRPIFSRFGLGEPLSTPAAAPAADLPHRHSCLAVRPSLLLLLLDPPHLFPLPGPRAARGADTARPPGRYANNKPQPVQHLHINQDTRNSTRHTSNPPI